jgi:hypothetical protein
VDVNSGTAGVVNDISVEVILAGSTRGVTFFAHPAKKNKSAKANSPTMLNDIECG